MAVPAANTVDIPTHPDGSEAPGRGRSAHLTVCLLPGASRATETTDRQPEYPPCGSWPQADVRPRRQRAATQAPLTLWILLNSGAASPTKLALHAHHLKHEHSHLCWQMGSVFGDGQKGTDGLLARKPGLGHSYFSKSTQGNPP